MPDWDDRYGSPDFVFGTEPNDFLVTASACLPPRGLVVSLGEGEGRNGVFLAEQGFQVIAIDGSAVGLEKAKRLAASRNVAIETIAGDLADIPFPMADGIISIFCHLPSVLRRDVYRRAKAALRPGGIFILEAYHPDQIGRGTGGPSDPDMLIRWDDLQNDWADCERILGQEIIREVNEGPAHHGMAAVTQAIFRKPSRES
jgi:SAM-dependent methyltransferase